MSDLGNAETDCVGWCWVQGYSTISPLRMFRDTCYVALMHLTYPNLHKPTVTYKSPKFCSMGEHLAPYPCWRRWTTDGRHPGKFARIQDMFTEV